MKEGRIMIKINNSLIIDKVNYAYITKSRTQLIQNAEVHIASKYIYEGQWCNMTELLAIGDSVDIIAGYNDRLECEFTGYIAEITKGFPVKLRCEDEMWRLKREDVKPSAWQSTTLKEVLEHVVGKGKITGDIPSIVLKPFYIKGKLSKLKVLEALKGQYGIDIYFRRGKLYGGFPYQDGSVMNKVVVYDVGYNTIDEQTSLKYREEKDIRLKVRVVSILQDNTRYEVEIGDSDGELRTLHLYNVPKSIIRQRAEEELKKWKFSGYTGSIRAFAEPYCEFGQVAEIRDYGDSGRNSRYFIDGTSFECGITRGLRRSIKLGRREK